MAGFDLSLVVRGTDEGASATGKKLEDQLNKLAAAEERAALAAAKAKVTADNLKQSYSTQGAVVARLAAEEAKLAQANANLAARTAVMGSTFQRSRTNLANFGQQIQDVTQQIALGVNPMTIMIQQGGQLAYSLNGIGGAAGKVARFFAGPLGSILIATAGILGMLALRGNEAAKSQENLGDMADYVGRAQSQLGKVIDLVTGKFSNQNIVLREAIRLQAILAQQQAHKDAQAAGKSLSGQLGFGVAGGPVAGALGAARQLTGFTPPTADFRKLIADYKSNASASFTEFRQAIDSMAREGKLKGIDINATLTDALKIAVARGEIDVNKDIQKVLEGGKLPDYLSKPGKTARPKKERKGPDPFILDEFGRDAADRIRNIAKGFADTPAQVERVNSALSQLRDLVDDIQHKKPPNMKELLADAEKAKTAIQDGVNKPFNDFILAQQESLDVARLIAQGRDDEAEALALIQRIQREQGPLDAAHKNAILASVQALREEAKAAQILHEKQQKYLDLVNEVKDSIKGIISDPVQGLKDLPKRLIGAVANLRTEELFEKFFGPAFRDIEDKITGQDKAKESAERMSVAVDQASEANRRASAAVADLGTAASRAATALSGTASAANGASAFPGGGGVDPLAPLPDAGTDANGNPIVITGQRPTNLAGILQGLAKGVGVSDEAAKKIGSITGKAVGGAATGALTNSFLKPLGKALGFKTSATGAQIGGAIGAFIPIPGGDIIGSIIGSVVGGLFKKTKKGSTTITNAFDVGTTTGNNAAARDVSASLAEGVQGALLQIADQLGGTLGSFSVSIGQRHGDFRVDPSGRGQTKISSGAIDFNDDEAGAIAFAIADAIRDGAITGLSTAVQRALASSPDVEKGLREALKVQQLETLINGIGGQLEQVFRQADNVAAERVRLAKAYGLDVLKVEKINAEERAKLLDDVLKSRLGALEDLQKEFLFGDLFEGDAGTRRNALLSQISKAMADAEAGIDGATDELASLYQQLAGTSREAFGTAGPEYSSDRTTILTGLDHILTVERQRVERAAAYQDATLAAANQNNALTNEGNNLLARIDSRLSVLVSGGGFTAASGGGGGLSLETGGRLGERFTALVV